MAETKSQDEPTTLPAKRKLNPLSQDKKEEEEEGCDSQPNKFKKPILEPSSNNPDTNPSFPQENVNKAVPEPEQNGDEEEEENDGDYDDDDGEEEEENGEAVVVDRKGKGIMIEEEEEDDDDDDDDDDSSDDGSELDGDDDSELEDDPLAEVDLDNILPSRTRRKAAQPGVYIANDLANDDDDSDDSDDA